MSTTEPSLTLPKARSRVRWRRRKPRKPSFDEIWWLCWTVFAVVVAIQNFMASDVINGTWLALVGGCYWRAYQRARIGRRPHIEMPLIGLIFASVVALTLFSVPEVW